MSVLLARFACVVPLVQLACAAVTLPAAAEEAVSAPMPVSRARDGFSADLSYRLRQGFTYENAYKTGDHNLYYFLHWEEFVPHNVLRRDGAVRQLTSAPDDSLGRIRAKSSLGELTLDELLANPKSRIQGFIVVRHGRVIYERYPGMRPGDHHLWFSCSKTLASLLVGLLEAQGKIDVDKAVETYLPELAETQWRGIRIIDILDMASGLDIVETEQSRNDPASDVNHYFRIDIGQGADLGKTAQQVLFSVKKKGAAGQIFEYSSFNTLMLAALVERVSGRRLADLISDQVWSKMGAEAEALISANSQGGAGIYGLFSSRLRDMARYAMLYTPSWKAVASQPVVPQSLLDKIQKECRPGIYENAARAARDPAGADRPKCNSRQWDAVWPDGDLFKGGARGQGIYASPSRDVVVAYFSTTMESGWQNYARAVAQALASRP